MISQHTLDIVTPHLSVENKLVARVLQGLSTMIPEPPPAPPPVLNGSEAHTFLYESLIPFAIGNRSHGSLSVEYRHRSIDEEILDVVTHHVSKLDGAFSVLEFGAGRSFPLDPSRGNFENHVDAPWLARKLVHLFGDRPGFSIIATDPGRIGTGATSLFLRFTPEDRLTFSGYPGLGPPPTGDSYYYERAIVDQGFEKETFGLDARSGVSTFNASSLFPESSFDLVFARHLPPDNDEFQWNFASLVPLLKPGGRIIAEVAPGSEYDSGYCFRHTRR